MKKETYYYYDYLIFISYHVPYNIGPKNKS